jgi:hypothetical protein
MRLTILTRLLAAAALLTGALIAAPATAGAAPPVRCWIDDGLLQNTSTTLEAWAFNECVGPESSKPLNYYLQRFDPPTGTWFNVVPGHGLLYYTCTGTVTNQFRLSIDSAAAITANCV